MKALVLCGGIPQIALLKYLRNRGITTVLADMNESVAGKAYADIFYPVSVFDIDLIKSIAQKENVDFVITVCADQVLQVVAQISEALNLPCYIDYKTAINVSKKSYMKEIFIKNGIPTSKYVTMSSFDIEKVKELKFPLIVKPVDSYSSRGVCKVQNFQDLKLAFERAILISRTNGVIIEEFVHGDELTVDVYVENGSVHLLCVSNIDKITGDDKFIIHRTRYPANISEKIELSIQTVAQKIADSFGLVNAPMLIQLITNGTEISVLEFCARTGGGDKFRLIEKVSGFDVVKAVADLTLGEIPYVSIRRKKQQYIFDEFLYCETGIFDHLEGFDKLVDEGVISEYFQLKNKGAEFVQINSSGDRVAYFSVVADTLEDIKEKYNVINNRIKVIDVYGKDILRHDLIMKNIL